MSYVEFLGQYGDLIVRGTLVTIVLTVLAALLAVAVALTAVRKRARRTPS
jgi:polar amino acid transport system permease protein